MKWAARVEPVFLPNTAEKRWRLTFALSSTSLSRCGDVETTPKNIRSFSKWRSSIWIESRPMSITNDLKIWYLCRWGQYWLGRIMEIIYISSTTACTVLDVRWENNRLCGWWRKQGWQIIQYLLTTVLTFSRCDIDTAQIMEYLQSTWGLLPDCFDRYKWISRWTLQTIAGRWSRTNHNWGVPIQQLVIQLWQDIIDGNVWPPVKKQTRISSRT